MFGWVDVEVVVQLSQLSLPLAALLFVSALDFEVIQRSFQSFVFKGIESLITARTRFVILFDFLNAVLTECISTAGSLVGLSKN